MKSLIVAVAVVSGLTNVAYAQQGLTFVDRTTLDVGDGPSPNAGQPINGNTYVNLIAPFPGRVLPNGNLVFTREFVRLNDLLTASGGVTQGQLDTALAPIVARQEQLSATLTGIASRLDRITDRFREGVALAGSINVLPPNPGDRFAVSFGGAGYEGAGAGSVAVSARLREDIIAYGAVARSANQTLVKGGVGFSFR